MIQITKEGTISSSKKKELENLQNEFNENHCILLPNFLEEKLLKFIQSKIQEASFYTNIHPDSGVETCMKRNNPVLVLLQFLANDEKLFRLIERLTGCEKTNCFVGRIYSFMPGKGHHHSWHEDVGGNRLVAMSINLSTDIYSGGILKIRDRKSRKIYQEISNTGFGDAVLFRIADHLEHKVTHIKGTIPKIAFAGWFRSKISYDHFLKRKVARLNNNDQITTDKQKQLLTTTKLNNRVIINKEIAYRKFNEDTFLLNVNNSKFCELNLVGSRVWQLLSRNKNLQKVLNIMKKEFDVPLNILQRDILQLAKQLNAFGMIKTLK